MARYGIGGWIHSAAGTAFPWGTFVVNVGGCLLLGLSIPVLRAVAFEPEVRALLVAGVLSAFTTFSTFSYEAIALLQDGDWAPALAYLGGSVGAGLLAMVAGLWLSMMLLQG